MRLTTPRHHVKKNCAIVRDTSGEHKKVPRSVEVASSVECKKDNAECIGEPAGGEPENAIPSDGMGEQSRRKNAKPSLKKVDKGRRDGKFFDRKALEDDAGDGECPLHYKY